MVTNLQENATHIIYREREREYDVDLYKRCTAVVVKYSHVCNKARVKQTQASYWVR